MPRRRRINGRWYTADNAPAWFEDIRPAVANPRTDAEEVAATRQAAQANGIRNARGSERVGCIIVCLGLAIVILMGILVAWVLL